jgi:hypothetical protein
VRVMPRDYRAALERATKDPARGQEAPA